jgi:hypothetical protein
MHPLSFGMQNPAQKYREPGQFRAKPPAITPMRLEIAQNSAAASGIRSVTAYHSAPVSKETGEGRHRPNFRSYQKLLASI